MVDSVQKIPLVVGITGGQTMQEEYAVLLFDRVYSLLYQLRKSYPHTPVVALCSLTAGTSTLCARAALKAGCTLVAALPMELDVYREDFAEGEERDAFEALLSQASNVVTVPTYEPPPEPENKKDAVDLGLFDTIEQEIPHYYYYKQAGIYIAKHSNMLLSCWDGRIVPDEERAHDFTIETTRLAQEQPFSKMAGTGTPQNHGVVLQITTPILRAPRTPKLLPMRVELHRGTQQIGLWHNKIKLKEFSYINTFNRDATRTSKLIGKRLAETKAIYFAEEHETQLPENDAAMLCILAQADILAIHFQRRRVYAQFALALTGLLFVIIALLNQIADSPILLAVYAVLVAMAFLSFSMSGKKRYAKKYIRYRLLSQFMCVQFYTELANIRDYFFSIPWWQRSSEITFAEKASIVFRKTDWSSTVPYNLDLIYRHWIASEHFHYRYEAYQKQKRATKYHKLSFYVLLLALASFFIVDISALNSPLHYTENIALVVVTKLIVGSLAAAIVYLIYNSGTLFTDERLKRSVQMYRSLTVANKRLNAARKPYKRRIVLSLYLLLANTEVTHTLSWYAYYSKKEKVLAQKRKNIPKNKFWIPKYMRKRTKLPY